MHLGEIRLRRVELFAGGGLLEIGRAGEHRPALVQALGDELHEGIGRAPQQADEAKRVRSIAGESGVKRGHHRRIAERILQRLAELAREFLERRGRRAQRARVHEVDDRSARGAAPPRAAASTSGSASSITQKRPKPVSTSRRNGQRPFFATTSAA